jgi:hypothetical protein
MATAIRAGKLFERPGDRLDGSSEDGHANERDRGAITVTGRSCENRRS